MSLLMSSLSSRPDAIWSNRLVNKSETTTVIQRRLRKVNRLKMNHVDFHSDDMSTNYASSSSTISSSPSASPFTLDRSSNHSPASEDSRSGVFYVNSPTQLQSTAEHFNANIIEFPSLGSDEIDRLLGNINDSEQTAAFFQLERSRPKNYPSQISNQQIVESVYEDFEYSNFHADSEEILLTSSSLDEIISNESINQKEMTDEAYEDLQFDSESTLTGSETEMWQAEFMKKKQEFRKRYSKRIIKKPKYLEDTMNLSDSDDESTPDDMEAYKNSYLFGCCPKETQSDKLNDANSFKPWWPKAFLPEPSKTCSATSEQGKNRAIGDEKLFLNMMSRIWKKRRQRKQLELWQFILKKLDGQQQPASESPFKWVNRSCGIFRITDTRHAADEWGKYRNNSRMDYEKMARAMRFYYKHSILRKARQQLHFQFSMPFVEYFRLHKHSNNESNK